MSDLEVKVVGAAWCEPCKALKPVLKGLCEEHELTLTTYDVDTVEGSQFASQYGVRGVPTTIVFENGQVKTTLVGMKTKQELMKAIGIK